MRQQSKRTGQVASFKLVKQMGHGPISISVRHAHHDLGFGQQEDAVHRGYVPDTTLSTHQTSDALIGTRSLELRRLNLLGLYPS